MSADCRLPGNWVSKKDSLERKKKNEENKPIRNNEDNKSSKIDLIYNAYAAEYSTLCIQIYRLNYTYVGAFCPRDTYNVCIMYV